MILKTFNIMFTALQVYNMQVFCESHRFQETHENKI